MRGLARTSMIVAIIVTTLLAVTLAGCTSSNKTNNDAAGKETNNATEPASATQHEAAKQTDKPLWDFKFDPPVTITTAVIDEDRPNAFKPGENFEDNTHTRWMKDNLGIITKIDWTVGKPEDYETKLQLLLATNSPLPDTFFADGQPLQNLITADKLMPLNDAIEKYASPTLKEVFKKYPYTLGQVTKDGKIYGIPRFFMGNEGTVMWVRKDWLDKLDLQPPTTIAELEDVLKAFTENDPNGNNKRDEVGLAVPLKEGPFTWMGQTDAIVGAFTDHMINTNDVQLFWNEDDDGKLVYGAVHPDAIKYLETMRSWMSKGYISKEAGIMDPTKAAELAASGRAGVMFGPYWMGNWPLADTKQIDPNAEWMAYPLPAGPDGKVRLAQKPLHGGALVFRKDFEHIDAWFAYYNKLLAKAFGPDDPYFDPRLKNGYHVGYDYVEYNGKIYNGHYEEAGVPKELWPLPDGTNYDMRWTVAALFGTNVPLIPYLTTEPVKKFLADPNAEATTPIEIEVKSYTPWQLRAAEVNLSQQDKEIPNLFTGPMTPTMKKNGEFLKKLATESYLKIIYGEKPLEYFEEFVKEWYKNGGEQVTQEVNEWYANNK